MFILRMAKPNKGHASLDDWSVRRRDARGGRAQGRRGGGHGDG